ncbi:hypothetical protein DFS34DRAFT_594095 [Phlyctochytrium arcticum]|nr:hypothetical protein DFS34DRAFT_594095 [Phlyctochytrium arcticum]
MKLVIPPEAARSQALHLLQRSLPAVRSSKLPISLSPVSRRQALLTYYPPDINIPELAKQDTRLKALNLVDQWKEKKIAREEEMTKRGKTVWVSVLTGLKKKPEGGDGKKKKKK